MEKPSFQVEQFLLEVRDPLKAQVESAKLMAHKYALLPQKERYSIFAVYQPRSAVAVTKRKKRTVLVG